ncbi:MAG: hypothetical protein ACRDRS_00585 [Pseudonocardiaceae bacterium]
MARRHGRLRAAAAFLRCDDAALLTELRRFPLHRITSAAVLHD